MPGDVGAQSGRERALLGRQKGCDVQCYPEQNRGGDGNSPIGQDSQHLAPYPIRGTGQQQDCDNDQRGCNRGAPQPRQLPRQTEKRWKMLDVPIKIEVAAEQARSGDVGKVEEGCRDHEQCQHEREAARRNKTRTGQGDHRNQKKEASQFGGGAPLDGQTMSCGIARRHKKRSEHQHPQNSRKASPPPRAECYRLRRGWRHREPQAMSS